MPRRNGHRTKHFDLLVLALGSLIDIRGRTTRRRLHQITGAHRDPSPRQAVADGWEDVGEHMRRAIARVGASVD